MLGRARVGSVGAGGPRATEAAREALRYGFEEVGLPEIVSFTATGTARCA